MSCGICDSLLLPEALPYGASLDHPGWHELYLREIQLALSRWPLIRLIEVALRNKISLQLESRFGEDFFLGQPKELFSGEQFRLREAQRACRTLSRSEVVRNLPMGFWMLLLSKKYESTLWAPALRHCFSGWAGRPRRLGALPDDQKLTRTLLLLEPGFQPLVQALQPVESQHEQ